MVFLDIFNINPESQVFIFTGEKDENKSSKKTKKRVGFVEPKVAQPQLALNMLSYLQRDSVTQDILLRDHVPDIINVKNILKQSLVRQL